MMLCAMDPAEGGNDDDDDDDDVCVTTATAATSADTYACGTDTSGSSTGTRL